MRSVVALFLFAAAVAAQDAKRAADAVLADEKALRAFAAKDAPDPWIVADELSARGEHEAAARFAQAAGARKGFDRLPGYVAARRGAPGSKAAREALAKSTARWKAKDYTAVLAALSAVDAPGRDVAEVQVLTARAKTLLKLRRVREAVPVFAAAAGAADRLGWWTQAARLYYEAGRHAARLSAWRNVAAAWSRQVELLEVVGWRQDGALNNLGVAYRRLGRYDLALQAFERSAALKRAAGDRASAVRTLGNIANLHFARGDYERTVKIQREVLAANRELKQPDIEFDAWSSLCILYKRLGNMKEALACADRAFDAAKRIGDREHMLESNLNASLIYKRIGRLEEARALQERALALATEETDVLWRARIHNNLGTIYARLEQWETAERAYKRALAVLKPTDERTLRATTLLNLGILYGGTGRVDDAIPLLERALAEYRAVRARGRFLSTLNNLGVAHLKRGDYARGQKYFERARDAARDSGERWVTVQSNRGLAKAHMRQGRARETIAAARAAIDGFTFLVGGLSDEQGASAREAWTDLFADGVRAGAALDDPAAVCFFLESGRAGSLLESLGGREWLHATAIDPALRRAETDARRRETNATRLYRRALARGKRAETRARRAELDRARKELGDVIARIQREAKAGAALVYPAADDLDRLQGRLRDGEALVLYGMLRKNTYALVVSRVDARVVGLGDTESIRAALTPLRLDAATALRKRLVDPLKLGPEIKRVLVSPHGAISFLPFVLVAGDREVVYVPSGTTYGLLAERRERRGRGVLALGDPEYTSLPRLPATRAEAQRVGDVVLLGKDATEASFTAALAAREGAWRAVHLACHARVDSERPMLSSLALTGGDLTTLDVFRLPIAADLVVLSACETARGKVYDAEGVIGFTRAFMFAGAPRVIVSLWKVDDEATHALMVKFYELWEEHPTATALRKAQEFVRSHENWKRPYYWAAWQLWGLPD